MKKTNHSSIIYRHLLLPLGGLYAASSLVVSIHVIGHILCINMHPNFALASIVILTLLQGCVLFVIWKNRTTISRIDTLIQDICAQAPPSYNMRPDTFWADFDNLFNTYLSSINRNYASELLVRQVEFSTLQSQINPHFLYNTLDSLRGHAIASGAEDIADMAEALSHFFRYSISRTGDFVTVQQELESIGNYFYIQQYRFGKGLVLNVNTAPEDTLSQYYMPKLILQPLVENCISHGFSDSPTKGHVTVSVTLSRTRLTITVEDDGAGMDSATLAALREKVNTVIPPQSAPASSRKTRGGHGGLALNNVNQRIKLFYGQSYGLFITATPDMGTSVVLELPLIDDLSNIPPIS